MSHELTNGIAALMTELKTIPDMIHEKARLIMNYRKVVSDAADAQDRIKAQISGEVAGDKSYTNDTLRKSEITARLEHHGEYRSAGEQQESMQREITLAEYESARLERRFRALLAEKDLRVALIQLDAAKITAGITQ